MATPLVLLSLLLLLIPAASGSDVQRTHPGENVTLNCQVEAGVANIVVEWTRPDLETPEYVLLHRDGHSDPTFQHPSFKGRVELVEGKLKDGDVSLILRNVSVNDNGTYECWVADGGSGRTKRANIHGDPIRRIQLMVISGVAGGGSKNEEPTDGNHNRAGLGAGLGLVCLAAAAAVIVVVVVVMKYKRRTDNQQEQPAVDEAVGDQLL